MMKSFFNICFSKIENEHYQLFSFKLYSLANKSPHQIEPFNISPGEPSSTICTSYTLSMIALISNNPYIYFSTTSPSNYDIAQSFKLKLTHPHLVQWSWV